MMVGMNPSLLVTLLCVGLTILGVLAGLKVAHIL